MRVSNSVEKAFQLAFLKLKRRRKGVGVGVTAALIRMAIGRSIKILIHINIILFRQIYFPIGKTGY